MGKKKYFKKYWIIIYSYCTGYFCIFFHNFFNKLLNYNEEKEIYNYEDNSNETTYDFLFQYIINCYLIDEDNIKDVKLKVNFNERDSSLFKNLHKNLIISLILLSIFCISKIIKTILIEVKYTIPKFIVYINYFF